MAGLVIVESPNKCETIRKALGSNYEVMSSVGHICDLDKKKMGIDLDTWTPHYVINKDKTDVVKKLKDAAKKHKNIYVATDADYEGHCISFNIRDQLPSKGKNIYRVLFKTMTKPDILFGIQNPIPFDMLAYQAQQARRMTDRVVGFSVSPTMWAKGLKGTSAGRVQSAALKFIVDREKEIANFKEEEYWTLTAETKDNFEAEFYGIKGQKFIPKNKAEVDDLLEKLTKDLIVSDYQKKERTRDPVPPYITSSLQKDAGTRFGWPSQKIMDVAQSLFANGLITYHRTDSTRTEKNKLIDLRDLIEKQHGQNYLSPKTIYYSKDSSQDAHEAIRPTYYAVPMTLSADESKLLELIEARFMASQMASAQFDQASVKLNDHDFEFRASGSILKFDGFLKVYGSSTKDVVLPALKSGQAIKVKKFKPAQHFTKPPARYTESSFVDLMEKQGIGRPATYAATIETLINRKYVVRENKSLKATEIGMMVCQYLEKFFSSLTSPNFTAAMEQEVDEIAAGKLKLEDVLNKFYQDLLKTLEIAKKDQSKNLFETEHLCQKCQPATKMIKRLSEHGIFLGCPNHPNCGFTLNINPDGTLTQSKVETGLPCPDCGNQVVERKSKFGKFLSCLGYPACTWTGKMGSDGQIAKKKTVELTEIDCPSCSGKMVKRNGRQGSQFLGCQNYPKCKQTMTLEEDGKVKVKAVKPKAQEIKEKCPKCKKNKLLIRENKKDGSKFLACSGFPACKFTRKYEGET